MAKSRKHQNKTGKTQLRQKEKVKNWRKCTVSNIKAKKTKAKKTTNQEKQSLQSTKKEMSENSPNSHCAQQKQLETQHWEVGTSDYSYQ